MLLLVLVERKFFHSFYLRTKNVQNKEALIYNVIKICAKYGASFHK
mgnify:CR=1 FL=1